MPELGEDPAKELYAFEEEYSEPLSIAPSADLCSVNLDLLGLLDGVSSADAMHRAALAPGNLMPSDAQAMHGDDFSKEKEDLPARQHASNLPEKKTAAPDAPPRGQVRTVCLRPGMTLYRALKSVDIHGKEIARLVKALGQQINLRKCRPGDKITIFLDEKGGVDTLIYDRGLFDSYVVSRGASGTFLASKKKVELERHVNRVSGTFTKDLYGSFAQQGLSKALALKFADIFATRLDFNTDIHLGDSFSIIYEEYWRNGTRLGTGRILAASYSSVSGKVYTALYFDDEKSGNSGYFAPDGTPFGSYFLKSPLKVYRVTSRFTSRRFHPILKVYRPHYGVDLAAPTGTPVMAVADGVVSFVGWQRGYGRIVSIDHPGGYTTYYGHLSRFGKGVKKGHKVHQKQIIGYVGRSGYATGPHLDYRVKKNGRWINPFGIRIRTATKLKKDALARFKEVTAPLVSALSDSQGPKILAVEKTAVSSLPDGWSG